MNPPRQEQAIEPTGQWKARPVHEPGEIAELARVAADIWREYFPPLIGEEAVEAILEHFQSPSALHRQIHEEGYRYFIIACKEGQPAGYIGYWIEASRQRLHLSKLYLSRKARGHGLGRNMLDFVISQAREQQCSRIELTVLDRNELATAFYRRYGFRQTRSFTNTWGGRFAFTDHVFEYDLEATL